MLLELVHSAAAVTAVDGARARLVCSDACRLQGPATGGQGGSCKGMPSVLRNCRVAGSTVPVKRAAGAACYTPQGNVLNLRGQAARLPFHEESCDHQIQKELDRDFTRSFSRRSRHQVQKTCYPGMRCFLLLLAAALLSSARHTVCHSKAPAHTTHMLCFLHRPARVGPIPCP